VCVNLERHDRGHVSNPAHEEGSDVDDTQSEGKKSQNERVIKKSLKDEVGNKRLLTAPPPHSYVAASQATLGEASLPRRWLLGCFLWGGLEIFAENANVGGTLRFLPLVDKEYH